MAKRRHRPVLDKSYGTMARSPIGKPAEAEFGPPAELARNRSKAKLKYATRARLRAYVVDEHDLAARADHSCKFIEGGFGFRHRGNHELSHDDIEGAIRQRHPRGIHHRQRLDIAEPVFGDTLVRFAQHRFG